MSLSLSTVGNARLGGLTFGDDDLVDYDPVADTFRFTWDSEPDKTYGVYWSFDLTNWEIAVRIGHAEAP